MPLSPEYTAGLASSLVDLYLDAEAILLARIARALKADIDAPDWAERKLIQMQLVQAQTARQVAALTGQTAEAAAEAIVRAYNRGAAVGQADVAALLGGRVPALPPGLPAVEALVGETVSNLAAANTGILRFTDDVFRSVIARTAPQVLLGTQTRVEAAQAALNRFASRGVTGFVDRAGRRWALESYAEMATRTATMNAATQGHTDRLLANGHDLVMVSDAPQECQLCRPWEGQVLSLTGARRADGVEPAGTLTEARAAGLFHPGCRHSVGIFIPGVTKAPKHTADPAGDRDRQYLRDRERKVREWKRREAAALTPEAAQQAKAKVRDYQGQIRQHVATTSAKRQPHRERLGAL